MERDSIITLKIRTPSYGATGLHRHINHHSYSRTGTTNTEWESASWWWLLQCLNLTLNMSEDWYDDDDDEKRKRWSVGHCQRVKDRSMRFQGRENFTKPGRRKTSRCSAGPPFKLIEEWGVHLNFDEPDQMVGCWHNYLSSQWQVYSFFEGGKNNGMECNL